jgi:thiol-disulfide isomerase/thioredoxin
MRKGLILTFAFTLLLTACADQRSQLPVLGEVVSCTSVQHANSHAGLALPCLDKKSTLYFAALRGPLIVNVWGSWCAPCKEEVPFFRSFYAKTQSRIQLLGVDVEEAKSSDGVDFVIQNGMTWPSLADPDGRSRGFFGMGVPVTWFIDASGVVVHKKIGVLKSEAELRDLTQKYLHITIG